ncbi:hypothetical protein RRG08_036205 [Elysia crispata]|uniref:Uncharacterized protein n=1 Tax=Elysia crispata TaxID=231223 RepID=A0AAE0XEH5_9GAST|nr:hypothetical protein RRG08_036205 [Elysia crispata]
MERSNDQRIKVMFSRGWMGEKKRARRQAWRPFSLVVRSVWPELFITDTLETWFLSALQAQPDGCTWPLE